MKYFIPVDLTISDSSIPEHEDVDGIAYDVWTKIFSYEKGKKVSHNGNLYEALDNIYPLATYSWNDVASGVTPIVTKLSDDTIVTPTAVPCVANVTVVYVVDTWKTGGETAIGKYYLYTGATKNVDFTTIDPSSPSSFSETRNIRHLAEEPTGTQTTLSWKYMGATNRNKATDKSFNSQSKVESSTEEWWEITIDRIKSVNKIVLFNIQASNAKVTIYTTDINSPIYESAETSLQDLSSIIDRRTKSLYVPDFTNDADYDIPVLFGYTTATIRVTLTNAGAAPIYLGEILAGLTAEYGLTADGVPTQVKSSGNIIEKSNGDIVFEDEGDPTKVFVIFNFKTWFDSDTFDSIVDKSSNLINRRVVVFGEDSDEVKYRKLIIYGFIRDASPILTSNNQKSNTNIQIQRFK